MKISNNSKIMNLFLNLKFNQLAWSFRRLYCPVKKNDLVLEVGSGGNPYFRSNVLLDSYLNTRERHWVPLITDRPTILGFVENLPFQDKSFDFVIASHVLEHSTNPSKFLQELQRVSKAGYIEVPDAFMERINPYLDHRSEITIRNNKLLIKLKPRAEVDPELVKLYTNKVNKVISSDTMRRFPFHFHVRYYWNNNIDFEITNPDIDANWLAQKESPITPKLNFRANLNKIILQIVRYLFSQNNRNNQLNLNKIFMCPKCNNNDLQFTNIIFCSSCNTTYNVENGIYNFKISIN